MAFRYNAKRDVTDNRDKVVQTSNFGLPAEVDLSQWEPPVTDQGQEGSCTAHAGVRLLSWLYKKYRNQSFIFSPQFLYRAERIVEGDVGSDDGAQSRTVVACLHDTGCCLESTFPYRDDGWRTPTTQAMLREAQLYRIGAYHRVPTLDALKSILAGGYTAILGIEVYSSFESDAVASTGRVPVPDPGKEQCLGGHEVFCHGYDDQSEVLLMTNSWGTGWGDAGHFTLPYDYWPHIMDVWTAHFGPPWKA
jgi:C1A family cysteine protease